MQARAVLQDVGLKATVSERSSSWFHTVRTTLRTSADGEHCATSVTTELLAQAQGIPEADYYSPTSVGRPPYPRREPVVRRYDTPSTFRATCRRDSPVCYSDDGATGITAESQSLAAHLAAGSRRGRRSRRANGDTAGVDWPVHVLRASDGSHYVAFSLTGVPGLTVGKPLVLYIRLATRRDERAAIPVVERSAVAEWLAGQRSLPPRPERGIAFGEMPTYGATAATARAQTNVSQSLALLEMERDRARERREERERERKAALDGESVRTARALLPFEDFDIEGIVDADANGAAVIRRSLTAGPGDYVLTVAWHDDTIKDPDKAVRIFHKNVALPIASTSDLVSAASLLPTR